MNALSPISQVRADLYKLEDQFKLALPSTIDPQRFIRVVLTALQQSPDLLKADRASLFAACMKCATDGLIPDGREAALVVYRMKGVMVVQYLPMVTGILKKVRNSGELSTITAQIVYEHDQFKYWVDSKGEHIEHHPVVFGDRGAPIGAYAIAQTKDGALYIEIMNEKQIQDVRGVSRAKDFGPWSGPFADEMKRKTVIRRLSKRLPMSTDLEQVIHRDDELFDFTRKAPAESGLAAEINNGREISQEGDSVESLSDLLGGSSGQLSHQNQGSNGGELSREHSLDVPEASPRTAPEGLVALPSSTSKGGGRTQKKGLGVEATWTEASDVPSGSDQ